MSVHDYFAELYVAGRLADAGWNIYFPHRDQGFDFIISKSSTTGSPLIRPVQVKGKYPTEEKGDKTTYGYIGELSQTHPEMVLAIALFSSNSTARVCCTAYMPIGTFRLHSRGYRCEPATFRSGEPQPRRDFRKFFDEEGLRLLGSPTWKDEAIVAGIAARV